MLHLANYLKKGLPFLWGLLLKHFEDSYSWLQLVALHSLSYLFFHTHHCSLDCAHLLMLFHLTEIRFSQSTHLLMCLSLETLTCIITTRILVELIDLVSSIIIFLSQTTILRWFNVGQTDSWLWFSQSHSSRFIFFLLTLVFVFQWISFHWGILIMLLSQFPMTFLPTQSGVVFFIAQFLIFVIISQIFHEMVSLILGLLLLLLLLLLPLGSRSRLQSVYVPLIVNIRPGLIYLNGFLLLLQLP